MNQTVHSEQPSTASEHTGTEMNQNVFAVKTGFIYELLDN